MKERLTTLRLEAQWCCTLRISAMVLTINIKAEVTSLGWSPVIFNTDSLFLRTNQ